MPEDGSNPSVDLYDLLVHGGGDSLLQFLNIVIFHSFLLVLVHFIHDEVVEGHFLGSSFGLFGLFRGFSLLLEPLDDSFIFLGYLLVLLRDVVVAVFIEDTGRGFEYFNCVLIFFFYKTNFRFFGILEKGSGEGPFWEFGQFGWE